MERLWRQLSRRWRRFWLWLVGLRGVFSSLFDRLWEVECLYGVWVSKNGFEHLVCSLLILFQDMFSVNQWSSDFQL
jgi:hypothetical protein